MAKYSKRPVNTAIYPASEVWAAAIVAQRLNGEYVKKESDYTPSTHYNPYARRYMYSYKRPTYTPVQESMVPVAPVEKKTPNLTLMQTMLNEKFQFTDADIDAGIAMREYFMATFMGKILSDVALSDFDQNVLRAAKMDIVPACLPLMLAMIACAPASYVKAMAWAAKRDEKEQMTYASLPVNAKVGDTIFRAITILDTKTKPEYTIVNATSTDENGNINLLFFCTSKSWTIGQTYNVRAKVKRLKLNDTQLNYVTVKD